MVTEEQPAADPGKAGGVTIGRATQMGSTMKPDLKEKKEEEKKDGDKSEVSDPNDPTETASITSGMVSYTYNIQ